MLSLVTQLCLTLCDPMDYSPPGSSVHGDSPGKNTGVGCHALLQGIFPTQGLNPGLPHCRQNLGDPSSIPGLERSAGEGIGYPLQYFWASLVAQVVKNLPAMWETWIQSLGWKGPMEKGKATHSSILA